MVKFVERDVSVKESGTLQTQQSKVLFVNWCPSPGHSCYDVSLGLPRLLLSQRRINISWKYQSRNERTERGNEWKAEWMGRDTWQVIRLHNFFIINFANIRDRLWLFKLIEKGCFVSRLSNSFPFRCRLPYNCGSNGARLTIIYSHRALDQGDEFEFLLIFTFARLLCVVFVVGC